MVSLIKFDFSFEILKEKSLFSVHLACYSKKTNPKYLQVIMVHCCNTGIKFWPK